MMAFYASVFTHFTFPSQFINLFLTFGSHFKTLIMTYEDALLIVNEELYTIRDGVRFVKKVVPETQKYLNEFNNDLLNNRYKLYNENAKDYALDGKFKPEEYRLSLMNEIFK
jgi:predicted HicB family RNase H-like nuclease